MLLVNNFLIHMHDVNLATKTSDVPERPQTGVNVQKKITCCSSIFY